MSVCFHGRSENFFLLRDVLQRVGMTYEQFTSSYADEVVVHEIGGNADDDQQLITGEDSAKTSTKSSTSNTTRVEFVRMSDVIRRLLNIDISFISTIDCNTITEPHL